MSVEIPKLESEQRPIRTQVSAGKLIKARENAGDQVTIGFSFAFDRLIG